MGQANEWCEELGLPTRFKLKNPGALVLRVAVYCGDMFDKEISVQMFLNRWSALRSRRLSNVGPNAKAAQRNDNPAYKAEIGEAEQEARKAEIKTA